MKKLLAAAMILCLVLCLAACGDSKQPEPASQPSGTTEPAAQTPEEKPWAFTAPNGTSIALDDDMKDVLAAIGEPQSYFEAASCAFDGLDKTYTYAGFEITTRPDGENDYVNSIVLTDDSVTTPEGLYIGCTPEDVAKVMGEGTEFTGGIGYFAGGTILDFIVEDGKVVSIEYLKE